MSWKPEVFVENKWSSNQLVFATEEEAKQYALDLFTRWTMCENSRAVGSYDPVTHTYFDGKLLPIEAKET